MSKEFQFEDVPAPGEPLQPHIDTNNQKLIEDDLQKRLAILGAKLKPKEHKRTTKRINQLRRYLNRKGYNTLVTERWSLYTEYIAIKDALRKKKTSKLIARGREIIARGNAINAKIALLKPQFDEFNLLLNRLKAHQTAIEFENRERNDRKQLKLEAVTWREQIKAVFRQSPRLHHAGYDSKGRYFCDIPRIERGFIKDDMVLFQIRTSAQGIIDKLLGRFQFALPYGVDVKSLTSDETLANLSASCNRPVSIVRSKRGTSLFYAISRLDSNDGLPNKVLYGNAISWYPVNDHAKTPWIAGVNGERKVEFYTFEDLPHILIAGSTQSGKSNHVNQMIATIATMNTPQEVRLQLIDLKGGIEFTHWNGLAHQLKPMVKTPETVLESLRYIRSIMEQRLGAFEAIKAKNLKSFNEKAKSKIPRIICIVDEMATLLGLGDLTTDIHNELRVLSSQGRAVGVHLVLCTQHSSVDVLPGWVKTNMTMRISGKMPSVASSMVILDSVTASTLPNLPGRLVFSIGRNETIAQSPYISDEEIANAVIISNQFNLPIESEFEAKIPEEKFSQNDILDMALNDFNGKLSANSIHAVLGNEVITLNKLRPMVKKIIEQNEILHEGKTYQIKKNRTAYYLVEKTAEKNDDGDTEEIKSFHYSVKNEDETYA